MLKQEYKEGETNLKQALDLSIKVLSKTLDTNKLTADKGIIFSLLSDERAMIDFSLAVTFDLSLMTSNQSRIYYDNVLCIE